jgi:hypothetical protein
MDTGVAVQPLQLHRDVEQFAVLTFIQRLETRLSLDGLLDGRRLALHRLRDEGGHLVLLGHRQAHGAAHVADAAARLHLVHGHDLTHVILAVFLGDVRDHLVAPVHAEIDVEVRHGHAFRVEKALEEQLVDDGIDVGDAHRIRHQRAGA